jgi:hypothetical protein
MSEVHAFRVRLIDDLEDLHKTMYPLTRVFSCYIQLLGTILLIAPIIAVIVVVGLARTSNVSLDTLTSFAFLWIASVMFWTTIFLGLDAAISGVSALTGVLLSLLALAFVASAFSNVHGIMVAIGRPEIVPVPPFSPSFRSFVLIGGTVAVTVYLAFQFYVIQLLLRATIVTFKAREADREVLRVHYPGTTGIDKLWYRLRSVPPIFEFIRKRKLRVALAAQLSGSCLAIATLFLMLAAVGPVSAFDIASDRCFSLVAGGDLARLPFAEVCTEGLIVASVAIPLVLAPVFLYLGSQLRRIVHRLARLSLADLQQLDPRGPVLFLRAFADDQIPLITAERSSLGRMVDLGQERSNLDQLLLEEATPYGPVVALGNPGDPYPPYGAARGYFEHKDWRQAVADLARNAIAIVVCIDTTANIWWEVDHIVTSDYLSKTMFFLHPKYSRAGTAAIPIAELAGRLQLGSQLGELPPGLLGFFISPDGITLEIARSSTFSHSAYLLTLLWFLRTKLGTRSMPFPDSVSPGRTFFRRRSAWSYDQSYD